MSNAEFVTPIEDQDRISALDVARGFALLGILIMNSSGMALYGSAYFNYLADGGSGPLNFFAWGAMAVYFEGAMRGLFSLLFGAGLIIFLERLSQKNPAIAVDIHARRMLWLILFGLINLADFHQKPQIIVIVTYNNQPIVPCGNHHQGKFINSM